MPSISIIIPCYNVKKEYLEECIQSVIIQTFIDFEVILIDDGSKDEYADLLDEVALQDSRIRVYHQANQGVSAARNTGVYLAEGKYITFIDADDSVTPWFLEQGFDVAEKTNADIVYGYNYRDDATLKKNPYSQTPHFDTLDDAWLMKYMIGSIHGINGKTLGRGPWTRIIKAQIAKNVIFPVGVPIGEDVLWNLEMIKKTTKRYLVNSIWYRYNIRDDSVTAKYDEKIEDKLMPFYERIDVYINDSNKEVFFDRLRNDLRHYILKLYFGNSLNKKPFIQKWIGFNALCKRNPWCQLKNKDYYKHLSFSGKMEYVLFSLGLLYPTWMIRKNVFHRQ